MRELEVQQIYELASGFLREHFKVANNASSIEVKVNFGLCDGDYRQTEFHWKDPDTHPNKVKSMGLLYRPSASDMGDEAVVLSLKGHDPDKGGKLCELTQADIDGSKLFEFLKAFAFAVGMSDSHEFIYLHKKLKGENPPMPSPENSKQQLHTIYPAIG